MDKDIKEALELAEKALERHFERTDGSQIFAHEALQAIRIALALTSPPAGPDVREAARELCDAVNTFADIHTAVVCQAEDRGRAFAAMKRAVDPLRAALNAPQPAGPDVRGALAPFAKEALGTYGHYNLSDDDTLKITITAGDLRRARNAYHAALSAPDGWRDARNIGTGLRQMTKSPVNPLAVILEFDEPVTEAEMEWLHKCLAMPLTTPPKGDD